MFYDDSGYILQLGITDDTVIISQTAIFVFGIVFGVSRPDAQIRQSERCQLIENTL